jgi:hypothetical protein
VLQDFEILPALPETLQVGFDALNAALSFIVFHEMAHIRLEHHAEREIGLKVDKHVQEFDADRMAMNWLSQSTFVSPRSAFTGAAIVLLSSSLASSGPDSKETKSHPSLVDRFDRLCAQYDSLNGLGSGFIREAFEVYLVNVTANLFDRDRCPCWLGRDRRAVLGLPADHVFGGSSIDFKSMGPSHVTDVTRAPSKTRRVDI